MLSPEQLYGNVLKIVEVKGPELGVTEAQGHRVGTEWVIKLGETYADVAKRVRKSAAPQWTDYDKNDLASVEAALGLDDANVVTHLDTPTAKLWQALHEYADEPDAPAVIAKRWTELSAAERAGEVYQREVQALAKRKGISESQANDEFVRTPVGRALFDIHCDTSPAASWDVGRYAAKLYAEDQLDRWATVRKFLMGDTV